MSIALFGTAHLVLVGGMSWRLASRLNQMHGQLEARHADLQRSHRDLQDVRTALNQHAIVAFTDARGRITSVNDKFCAISGYRPEELVGQDHRIINSGYHSKAFFADLWTTIRRGDVWHGELKNRAKNGRYYWVATTIVPFLDNAGVPKQYVAIRTDITRRKELEEALRQGEDALRQANRDLEERVADRTAALAAASMNAQRTAAELERSNAELQQFAYVASHDLQEPLRAVARCSEILRRRYAAQLDAGADELIRHILEGAERMHCLIEDLLAFSRVDQQRLTPSASDSAEALRRALANLRTAIELSGATITCDELPTVPADAAQLTLLFQNLIGNALKYHGADAPRIHIGAASNGTAWEFTVADNGIGIEAKYFDRIFSLFQRLHTRSEYPGTGIGLAICKKIVERHSGRIWLESTPGRGSQFRFTIPFAAENEP